MGWSQIIVTMGSIAGPVLAGVLADSTGDYRLGFTVLGIAAAFGVVFWVLAAPPTPMATGLRSRDGQPSRRA